MKQSDDVWWARHDELGRWALEQDQDELTYAQRFFDAPERIASAT
jgi:hypothetical protein